MDAIELSFSFFRSVCNPVSRRRLSAHLHKFFAALPFSSDAKTPIRPTDGTSWMELIWTLNEKCVNLIEFHISFLAAVQESASFAIAKLTILHTNFFFCTTSRSLILTLRARSLLTKILSRFSHEMEKKLVIRRHLAPATRGIISIENRSDNFTFGGHSTSLFNRSVHSGWTESTYSASRAYLWRDSSSQWLTCPARLGELTKKVN